MRMNIRVAAPLVLAGAVAACSAPRETPSPTPSPSAPAVIEQTSPSASAMGESGGASAQLSPTQGNTARGMVIFAAAGAGVHVTAHLEGLTPGDHGFHLHEKGDCSAPDASSAGDHWNPTHQPHGGPDSAQHHSGDLGNITADASGMAHMDRVVQGLSLDGAQSVLGRSVVVHGKADDLKSQPSGNSGPRQACGVVGGSASPAGGPLGAESPRASKDPSE